MLDVLQGVTFPLGVDMHLSLIHGVPVGVDSADLVNRNYVGAIPGLSASGDLLSHDGAAQSVLSVGNGGELMRMNVFEPCLMNWVEIPTIRGSLITRSAAQLVAYAGQPTGRAMTLSPFSTVSLNWTAAVGAGALLGRDAADQLTWMPGGVDDTILISTNTPGTGRLWAERSENTTVATTYNGTGLVDLIYLGRWGMLVTLQIPQLVFTGTNAVVTITPVLPVAYRPLASVYFTSTMINDTVDVMGRINVGSDGSVLFAPDAEGVTPFGNVNPAGCTIHATSLSWCIS
jgi:hypothetical protein